MQSVLRHKHLVLIALLFWLLAGWGGAHGHFCLDGQEPPLSIHMDMMGDHPEHHADEHHVDSDIDLVQLALAKLVKLDLPLLLAAALLFTLLLECYRTYGSIYLALFLTVPAFSRPLLRAPPVLPA